MSSATASIASASRMIRVFVSSTFRDMQAEREELVKRIFPRLRKLCESRGVTWGEVDLRWGITDEQKAEGKVLPICLEEIRRCRPYFIGLLGERYGWVPEEVPPAVTQQEPWLTQQRGHSVTELEILHGVLNNPQMANHAYFYFRDPGYIQSLLLANGADFEEGPTAEETKSFGAEEGKRRAEERQQKLAALKQRIRTSGLPLRENYANPQVLGELVLEDLTTIINRLFPEGSQPDPLDREASEHEAFARSRTGVYIGRQEYFAALDAHAAGEGPPLVVLGESGLGKSALLANWALRYQAAHPGELLLMHFIGATPASADWAAMVRRILGEFNRRFDLKIEIPDKPDALRMSFANAVYMVATRRRVILILDALNQLEDRDQAPDLVWLPPVLPVDVRLIVSTLPGRPLDDLKKRGWPTLQVEPLNPEERKKLIVDYLAQYAHALSPDRMERIAGASQAANPLYLRALLEELRLWGEHETLHARIEHYLSAATVPDLYQKILERYEQDYERDRPGLVRDTMTLLWAARRGLSEAELMDLLGTDRETGRWWTPAYWMALLNKRQWQRRPLPRAYWSPLYLAAEPSLVSRSGLIGFFHDYLRDAVRKAYLPTAVQQQAAHRTLARYFSAQPQGPRQLDELPWQWQEAGEWGSLADLLAQPDFFDALWCENEFEVKAYWARIERGSRWRMEQVYAATIKQPARVADHAWLIGRLLGDTGKPEAAFRLRGALVAHYRQQGHLLELAGALTSQALNLKARGDLDGAMALAQEALQVSRELRNRYGGQQTLDDQTMILYECGDLDAAMALYKEEERLWRELGDKDVVQWTLGKQAAILYARRDLDGAMALYKESERLCREIGDKADLATTLRNQALILKDRGDLDGAMALYKESERLCREIGDKDGLQSALGRQAAILYARGNLDGAMALYKEEERLCLELGNKDALANTLGNQANILYGRGDLDGSATLNKEAERLCRELGNKHRLARVLGNEAAILRIRGDLDGAMALYNEEERLFRELGIKDRLRCTLGDQATILYARGDLDGAIALHKEEERLCRELDDKDGLQSALCKQAVILCACGDLDGAMVLHKEAERLCREIGNKDGLQRTLGNQANVLYAGGDLDGAMALHKEAERLCRELGDKDALANTLGNEANILYARGDLDGSVTLHKEEEHLFREVGNLWGLVTSLANQAAPLSRIPGRARDARQLASEALTIAARHGFQQLVPQIQRICDSIRAEAA
ncbi:MAG: tetratricopeptide repeat protein [Candidatus Sulfotelmatobacter sp.]